MSSWRSTTSWRCFCCRCSARSRISTTGKRGRRTPFILIGTLVAAIAFISLSLVDDAQLKNLDGAAAIDDPAALRIVYQKEADRTLKTPDGETFVLEDTFTEDEFAAITSQVTNAEGKTVTNHDYTNYVVPARQAYAHQTTLQHPGALIGFIALLLVVLVAMATFRSPAVALMPDVTIKPLRSKANAVINLMGTGGGSSCWPSAWASLRAPCATRS
ncbi:MAG: hypothetical protein ACLUNO_09375 [Oscillospiraceae bacterium]